MDVLQNLVRREAIPSLAWLGKYDWLRLSPIDPLNPDGRRVALKYGFPQFDGRTSLSEYNHLKGMVALCQKSNALTLENVWLWTLSKLFASGPKLFKPTVEQCEAMAEVELDIPFDEYRQPYPVIIFEYPQAFCKQMADKLQCGRFPSIAVCHWSEQRVIHVSSIFSMGDSITALLPFRPGLNIEAALKRRADDTRLGIDFASKSVPIHGSNRMISPTSMAASAENQNIVNRLKQIGEEHLSLSPRQLMRQMEGLTDESYDNEFELGETLQRIALNFSLLMTHYPIDDKPLNPDNWRKHRKDKQSKDSRVKARGRELALSDIRVIEFDQTVTLYDTESQPSSGVGEPTGHHVRPHWRKGHWRMQAHGPQLTLRKRLFIKPLMVRKDAFIGDLQNTSVVYVQK